MKIDENSEILTKFLINNKIRFFYKKNIYL